MTELGQVDIEWEEPEEVWWFDRWRPSKPIIGPCKIFGEKKHLWIAYKDGDKWHIPKVDAYPTKRDALLAHYKFNEKRIIQIQWELNKEMQDLRKYYSEEYYD